MQRHRVQEKKQLVFDASIDGSSTSLGKLTEQEGGAFRNLGIGLRENIMADQWLIDCILH